MQGDDWHICFQSCTQKDRHLVMFPGVKVDDLTFGEQLGDAWRENAKVRAAVIRRFRPGMTGDPDNLTDLQFAILAQLT